MCRRFGEEMRISNEEVTVLKQKLSGLSESAKLYLFGSRIDDSKKGGDIDLLVVSDSLTQKDIRVLRIDFFEHFGEQKLDIILDNGTSTDPFIKLIAQKAVLL